MLILNIIHYLMCFWHIQHLGSHEMGRIFGGAIKEAKSGKRKKTGCHKGHCFWFAKLSNYKPDSTFPKEFWWQNADYISLHFFRRVKTCLALVVVLGKNPLVKCQTNTGVISKGFALRIRCFSRMLVNTSEHGERTVLEAKIQWGHPFRQCTWCNSTKLKLDSYSNMRMIPGPKLGVFRWVHFLVKCVGCRVLTTSGIFDSGTPVKMTWILDWKARLQSKFDSWAKMLGFPKGVHGGEQMEKAGRAVPETSNQLFVWDSWIANCYRSHFASSCSVTLRYLLQID